MRIFCGEQSDAANYYRVRAPLSVVRYRTQHEVNAGRINAGIADDYDVLWLQQHADPTTELIAYEFQQNGGQVVYDVDDWLFELPASWPCYDRYFIRGTGQPRDRLIFHERILRRASVITCSTEYLAHKLEEHLGLDSGVVKVLPNCILMGDWDVIPEVGHELDGPVLGWFGTENHWDDWWEITPAVDEALEKCNGHLALIGSPELVSMFPPRLAARTQIHELVKMRDFDQVRRLIKTFDVGLAWCTDRTEASKCRSPLKAFQYGAAGVPVIASQTVYGELPGFAGELGMIADSSDDLPDAILGAFGNLDLMKQAADKWKEEVWTSHSYETQALRWLEILK